jgi:hypothetical protein
MAKRPIVQEEETRGARARTVYMDGKKVRKMRWNEHVPAFTNSEKIYLTVSSPT